MVHLRDYAAVPAFVLDGARHEATRIFRAAGVELAWGELADTGMTDPGTLHLRLLILSREMMDLQCQSERMPVDAGTLGLASRAEAHAFILYPHLVAHVDPHSLDLPILLGRVFAHEIGHLVMPQEGHSNTGIMRARLDTRGPTPHFTSAQATAMRVALSGDTGAVR
jgi:hypothetical protein